MDVNARGGPHLSSASDAEKRKHAVWLLEAIVEHVPMMIFVKEAGELRFKLFNKAGQELLGIDRGEMVGKNDHDFFPAEQADDFNRKDREVLESGAMLAVEEPIETAYGSRTLFTKKIPLIDDDGIPRYLLGVSEDITERKAQELALHQSHRALEEALAQVMELEPLAITGRQAVALAEALREAGERPSASQAAIIRDHVASLAAVCEKEETGEVDLVEVSAAIASAVDGAQQIPAETPAVGRGRRADAVRIAQVLVELLLERSGGLVSVQAAVVEEQPALVIVTEEPVPVRERACLLQASAPLPEVSSALRAGLAVARVAAVRSGVIGVARDSRIFELRFCPAG